MKTNLPTQAEKPFPKGKLLASKTDLKGITTYANDAFIELSGFSREELIGKNHNIATTRACRHKLSPGCGKRSRKDSPGAP